MRNSRFNFCDCPAGFNAAPERHAPDCPGRSGAGKAPTPITKPLPNPPEFEPDRICKEHDGCPTEGAVLKRFWRDNQQVVHERDTLRDVLALLAPDLKAMAILYAQKGDHLRSQALANICKSVGVL